MIFQYSQPPPQIGSTVNVWSQGGMQTAVFNSGDATGQYGSVTFTSGPLSGQTLWVPFRR